MSFLAAVPPVPPPPHASAIQHLSVAFFAIGLVLVMAILPPVRRACRERMDSVVDFFGRSPKKAATATPEVVETTSTRTRKEIENFDLDIFS